MNREEKCPVTNKPFNCDKCKVPDMSDDGKCPVMKADDCIEEAIKILRRIVEDENNNTSEN